MTKFWEYLTLPYVCNLAHLKLQSLGCQQKLQSQSYVKDDSAVFFSMIMFDWKPPSVLLLILGGLGKSSGTINRALIGLASSLAITRSSKQVAAKSRYKKGTVAVFFFSCLFQFFSRNFFSTDNNTIVQLFFLSSPLGINSYVRAVLFLPCQRNWRQIFYREDLLSF